MYALHMLVLFYAMHRLPAATSYSQDVERMFEEVNAHFKDDQKVFHHEQG
eukprot:m.506130 g.506130  ORF g.506130 m.506130 type:complete len:50 (-) comp21872_c0_seq1:845-994(-)